ncbi:hypothetical protein, partial [Kitasatospora nipponensis]|uniref:hypothetical protein n=1 Tax=Kitasatospora nipponensis TaxID=258049 RepID=UPI0031DC8754
GPAPALLGGDGTDWDLRWSRTVAFGNLAAQHGDWLDAWLREEPDNGPAALVRAESLVVAAWQVRTSRRAARVSQEQWEGFHRLLLLAQEAALDAVRLAPAEDPNPWVVQVSIAMGLNWSNEAFHRLWAEIVDRDPTHWRAYHRALQYWCAKWHGSHELMYAFADRAIGAAAPGSLLTTLRMSAYWEHTLSGDLPISARRGPEYRAALEALDADLAAAPTDHNRLREARGWLAYGLVRSGQAGQALPHFHGLGRAIPEPWTNYGRPAGMFARARRTALRAAATAKAAV